jgi:hypothetical protein
MSTIYRLLGLATLVLSAWALVGPAPGGERNPDVGKQIDDLIVKLGSTNFQVREKAQQALLQLGKAALPKLHETEKSGADIEIRRRARALIQQIDPGAFRRQELEVVRAEARKKILQIKGVDAANWGEDIPNPFTSLTPEGMAKLTAEGIDAAGLSKLRSVLITGSYCGANSKTFVNRDPKTLIVLGKGFITHDHVYSVAPILAVEDAHIMGGVMGADLVWFVEKAWPRSATFGIPLIAGPESPAPHDNKVTAALIRGDYGWRRPNDFLKLAPLKPDAQLPGLAIANLADKKKQLTALIAAQKGELASKFCKPVDNPLKALTAAGEEKLRHRGVDPERLAKMKALLLTGSYAGANSKTIINADADTILVIGKGFFTHGAIFSMGPVVATDNAHFMNNVTSADVAWFVDESFPRGRTTGLPVIVAPTISPSQMTIDNPDVWYGDYGWPATAVALKNAEKGRPR